MKTHLIVFAGIVFLCSCITPTQELLDQESISVLILWDEHSQGSVDEIQRGLALNQDIIYQIVSVSFFSTEHIQGLIEESSNEGFEGIILFSSSEELLRNYERHAADHGIPAVTVSSAFTHDMFSVHLGTCPFTAGALAAKEVIRHLNFKGTVLLTNNQIHSASYKEIADGFTFYVDSFAADVVLLQDGEESEADVFVTLGAAPSRVGCYTVSVSDLEEVLMLYQEGFINALVHPNWEELAYESVVLLTHMLNQWTVSFPIILPSRLLAPY